MCFKKDKWKDFEPTKEYLSAVKDLTTVDKLYQFIQKFKYTGEVGDIWQTPEEFLKNEHLDCEDFAIFAIDVLVRVIGIDGAIFIAYYSPEKGHAVCVFPYQGEYSVFSNSQLLYGFTDYIDVGHHFFSELKRMVVRDWQGKILEKKRKWRGVF